MIKIKKYKRKNNGELIPPVEKTRSSIMIHSIAILKGSSLSMLLNGLSPFFLKDTSMKIVISEPNIWIVYIDNMVFCHIKTNINDPIRQIDCQSNFI